MVSECAQLNGQLDAARVRQEKQDFKLDRQGILINRLEVIMSKVEFALEQQDVKLNRIRASQEEADCRLATMESSQQFIVSAIQNIESSKSEINGESAKALLEELKFLLVEQPSAITRIEASQAANFNRLDGINTQLKEAVTAWKKFAEEYSSVQEDDLEEDTD